MSNHIEKIAEELSNHKIVPFIGAGCSQPLLNIDWNTITIEMNKRTKKDIQNNEQSASEFINQFGKEEFSKFLQKYLTINEFKDELGETHLAIMGFDTLSVYTTNQDNVFEKCIKKYGRPYNIARITGRRFNS